MNRDFQLMMAAFMFGSLSFIFSKVGESWWKYGASGVMGFLFMLTMLTFLSRQGGGRL